MVCSPRSNAVLHLHNNAFFGNLAYFFSHMYVTEMLREHPYEISGIGTVWFPKTSIDDVL